MTVKTKSPPLWIHQSGSLLVPLSCGEGIGPFSRLSRLFFIFSPTSSNFHPIQVENCDSSSRLVVDENCNGKFRLESSGEDIGFVLAR